MPRFSAHGPEHELLEPQILPPNMQDYPTLNETCVLRDSNRGDTALLKRQGSWIAAWVRSGITLHTTAFVICVAS